MKIKQSSGTLRRLSAAVLAISMLAACGGSDDSDSSDESDAPVETEAPADDEQTDDGDSVAAEESESDDTADDTDDTESTDEGDSSESESDAEPTSLIVSPPFPPESLDPHGATSLDVGTRTVDKALFDTVVTVADGEIAPSIAESWTNPDDTTLELTVRGDITFHDGSSLVAGDVAASLNRVIAQEGPLAGSFALVDTVEAPDDQTVVITTTSPDGTLLRNLSLVFVGPAALIDTDGYWSAPIGSGPFAIESFSPGETVVAVANTDYWNGAPALDRLEFRYLPDEFGRATALETGEIDLTWRLSDDTLTRLEGNDDVVIDTVAGYGSWVIWVNPSGDETSDKLVRQAMWHAVDWQQIIDDLFPVTGQLATSAVSPSVFGHTEMEPYAYDPDLARELLAEAGYPDGVQISAMFREAQRLISLSAISYWSEVGIEVEPLEKEHAVWLEDLLALNWEVNFMVQSAATGDADILIGRLYPCAAERTGYCNEELDELLLTAKQTTDQAERQAAYAAAIEILWEDVPGIFPIDVLEPYAMAPSVTGFVPDPSAAPGWHTVDNAN